VVISHGAGEHGDRYERLAERLVADGFAVWASDHRGHGRSGGPQGIVDRFRNAVADLDAVLDLANRQRAAPCTFMLGHSMGGAIALDYALLHEEKLAGLVLSAPAAALDPDSAATRIAARVMSELAPWLPIHELDKAGISRDPEEVRAYEEDPLIDQRRMRARTVGELVTAFGRFREELPRLSLPLLVMHGTADRVTSPECSRMIYERAGSDDKTLELYDGYYHELLNEPHPDRERVIERIASWLDERAPVADAA
jgi:alpha-beta hydrolase superfamily lysophospholipase